MEEKKTDTDTRTRTCAVILNKILKGDLSPEVAGIFKEKIKRTACSVTTDISELSFIVRSEMLALAAYGLRDQPMWTDIGRILPKDAQRCHDSVNDDGKIPVSPLNVPSIETGKNDFNELFSQNHLQSLHTQYLSGSGRSRSKKASHPVWEKLQDDRFESLPKAPQGLTNTINTAIRQYSVNLRNRWSGRRFNKALDRLVSLILRVHLAPVREARYHAFFTRKTTAEKEEQEIDPERPSRDAIRQQLHRLTKDINTFQEKAASAMNDDMCAKWQRRATNAYQKRKNTLRDSGGKSS